MISPAQAFQVIVQGTSHFHPVTSKCLNTDMSRPCHQKLATGAVEKLQLARKFTTVWQLLIDLHYTEGDAGLAMSPSCRCD